MKVVFLNPQQEMGGIQCLSAFVKQAGHKTALVNDPNLFQNPWINFPALSKIFENESEILSKLEAQNPDLVALSVVSDEFPWALKWATRIKNKMNVPIVVGNVHPTFHPEKVLQFGCFDYIVRGEGEFTLLELLECLEGKRDPASVLGLGFRKASGEAQINPMRPLIEDLDILPFPDKDLYYDVMPYLNRGYTTMTGRGCPYRCTFCDNNSSQNLYRQGVKKVQKWTRRHSPEYVVREILWAKERYNIRHVRFNDEDFSYDKNWIREFAPLYKKEVGIPFFAWTYPNTIDQEIANLLAEAGCDSVEMGIQSGAERIRKDILKRNTKNSQVVSSFQALRKAGIRATADIIIGLPTETKEDLDDTVRLLAEANPWHLYAFWLRYYPSTQILALAKERKLLSPEHIAYLESDFHSRGHLAGGTELDRDPLSRRYHTFILLLPLFPKWLILFFLRHDLIKRFPVLLTPFLLVNFTKMIKGNSFDEFRSRGWAMLRAEIPKVLGRAVAVLAGRMAFALRPPFSKKIAEDKS